MHDIRLIRDDPAAFDASLARRGVAAQSAALLAFDDERRAVTTMQQDLQARRNEASKLIGRAKAQRDEETASALMAEVAEIKERLSGLDARQTVADEALRDALAVLPNRPAADVPAGAGEEDNVLVHQRGEPPVFAFTTREHDAIGPALGLDFETGVAIAGARFTLSRGAARVRI